MCASMMKSLSVHGVHAHVSIVTPGTAPMLRCCMWINGGLHWLHYGWNTGRNWAALSWVVAIAMAAQTHTFMGLLLLKHIVLSAATYTPMHACVCKCISARARTCTPALAGAFLHMCTHTCAHARVHMHTRTGAHVYRRTHAKTACKDT